MMEPLNVRVYNVRFGDAILITVPDRGEDGNVHTRRILIDVGNSLGTEGGEDEVFKPVVEDILRELNGQPLDLYVMTHEHMDHIQGLPYAEKNHYTNAEYELRDKLQVQYAWLTASAAEDYYDEDKHPDAEKAKLQLEEDFESIESFLQAANAVVPATVASMLAINNPRSSEENVAYLRELTPNSFYIHRETDLTGKHPFREAKFEIWGPEEDTSVYYGRYPSLSLGFAQPEDRRQKPTLIEFYPPPGVDAGAFYNLINARNRYVDTLLAIDKAKNNTSIVFCLEWRGWRLLFTGDAEVRSWKTMLDKGALKPVHFLKISHHGSHNGTPSESILDEILPIDRGNDSKKRSAVVSTYADTYSGVPDADTLKRIYDADKGSQQPRCDELIVIDEHFSDLFVDFKFPADAPG